MERSVSGALAGVRVLDFSTLLPGPLACAILAEAGAEVLKVERPGGEDMRRFPPFRDGASAAFAALNEGRSILTLDLKAADAPAVIEPYLAGADVLVEQFRPGVMDRLGLGYEALHARFPRLIYCSISGYGRVGPRSLEAGHDLNYQARTGLLSLSCGTPGQPASPAGLIADVAGGSFSAVMNILLALRQRDVRGEGCHLDIAMSDAMATFAWYAHAEQTVLGRNGEGEGGFFTGALPRYRLYGTADGRFLAVGALEQKFWDAFCVAIDLDPARRDDRRDPPATVRAVAAIVGAQPAAHWRAVIEPVDCCCCVVATVAEAAADPHFVARGLFALQADGMPRTFLPVAPQLRRSASAEAEPHDGAA